MLNAGYEEIGVNSWLSMMQKPAYDECEEELDHVKRKQGAIKWV